jgi:site-specific recombinase XerD
MEMSMRGRGIAASGYCFTKEDGSMMHPQQPTNYVSRFGEKYSLQGIHPHALRHSMASIQVTNGANVVSVSKKPAIVHR